MYKAVNLKDRLPSTFSTKTENEFHFHWSTDLAENLNHAKRSDDVDVYSNFESKSKYPTEN